MRDRDFFGGFIRLHVLHHAARGPIYGQGIMDELSRHGYRLSPGTLYPLLHAMTRDGLLKFREEQVGGRWRRTYVATPAGRRALLGARSKIRELFHELVEEPGSLGGAGRSRTGKGGRP